MNIPALLLTVVVTLTFNFVTGDYVTHLTKQSPEVLAQLEEYVKNPKLIETGLPYSDPRGGGAAPYVVGGVEAARSEFPWIVNIIILTPQGGYLCGGNVISPTWILTAGHCLHGFNILRVVVTAGDHSRSQPDGTEQQRDGQTMIVHAKYNQSIYLEYDVALIELVSPLSLNGFVQAIRIANSSYPGPGGTRVMLAGWGRTSNDLPAVASDVLRKVDLTVVAKSTCVDAYQVVDGSVILDSMICAGGADQGACNGDSGGPIYCYGPNGAFVCGIASYGVGGYCGSIRFPGVYARVSSHANWVRGYVADVQLDSGFGNGGDSGVQTPPEEVDVDDGGGNNNSATGKKGNFVFVVVAIVLMWV